MKDLGKKAERGKSAKDRDLKVPTGKGWEDEGRCKVDTIRPRKAENMESKGIIFKRKRVVKNVQDQRRAGGRNKMAA